MLRQPRPFYKNEINDFRNLDGRDFSAMSEAEFSILVGSDPGNLLWSHFDLLRRTGMATVPSTTPATSKPMTSSKNPVNPTSVRSVEKRVREDLFSDVPKCGKKPRVVLGKYEEGKVLVNSDDAANVHRSGNNGNNVQLWKFLLDILTDFKHRCVQHFAMLCWYYPYPH